MSTQRKAEFVGEPISEQGVADYLVENPDFFERHRSLLASLQVPHSAGGAVSLVERQVSMLRQKELKMQRQLKELVDVARSNETLSAKIHRLSIVLLAARSLQDTVTAVEEAMRSGFGAEQSVLVHFGDAALFADIRAGRFFRVVDRDDPALKAFATFLDGGKPRCGRARDAQRGFLFHDDADEIGSMALVPLGEQSQIGFLAIGSADANRFHPGMSIDFLARVGDLVTGALQRF